MNLGVTGKSALWQAQGRLCATNLIFSTPAEAGFLHFRVVTLCRCSQPGIGVGHLGINWDETWG